MAKRFAFIDLETTGTDPSKDAILEIAWAFTDENFEIIGEPTTYLVDQSDWSQVFSRIRATPIVAKMHNESGLMGDLTTSNHLTELYKIRDRFYGEARSFRIKPKPSDDLHLAGQSVWFDKEFLEHNIEDVEWGFERAGFHHRLLDLSAHKLMFELKGIEYAKPVNEKPHRAVFDVIEAIELAKVVSKRLDVLL